MSRDISDISNPALRRLTIIVGFIPSIVALTVLDYLILLTGGRSAYPDHPWGFKKVSIFVWQAARKAW